MTVRWGGIHPGHPNRRDNRCAAELGKLFVNCKELCKDQWFFSVPTEKYATRLKKKKKKQLSPGHSYIPFPK
jgi:hypothetical protein